MFYSATFQWKWGFKSVSKVYCNFILKKRSTVWFNWLKFKYLKVARFPETFFWKVFGNLQEIFLCSLFKILLSAAIIFLFLTEYIQLKFVPKMNKEWNVWPHCLSIVSYINLNCTCSVVCRSELTMAWHVVSFSVSNISLEVLFYVSSGVTVSRSNIRDRLPSIGTLNLSKPNQLVTNSGFDYPTHWFCSWRCLEFSNVMFKSFFLRFLVFFVCVCNPIFFPRCCCFSEQFSRQAPILWYLITRLWLIKRVFDEDCRFCKVFCAYTSTFSSKICCGNQLYVINYLVNCLVFAPMQD